MLRTKAAMFLTLIMALAGIVGCGGSKVRFEKSEEIAGGEGKTYIFEGPTKDQKVKVDVKADEALLVIVRLEEKDDKDSLAKSDGKKEATLEVDIPAGKSFVVMIAPRKKCIVTTKVHSN